MVGKRKQMAQMDLVLEEVTRDTKNKIKELSFSYEKLSQILKKMPEGDWTLDEEEIGSILGRVSLEACTDCEEYYTCYKKNRDNLLQGVKEMIRQMEKQGTSVSVPLPDYFRRLCIRKKEFVEALTQSYEIISVHKMWQSKMLHQRKAMASQMEEMSRILFGCSMMLGFDKTKEGAKERQLRSLLKREKVNLGPVRFYENAAKRQEVFLMANARKDNFPAVQVAKMLSRITKKNMIPTEDCRLSVYRRNTLLHFEEDRNYYLLCGNAELPRKGNDISGDIFSVMRLDQGKEVCILADGMGTGEKAREESRHVVELMEQFLAAGFREEETVRLANSMLSFGLERSMYSSFDLFSFHLYTGLMKIIKSGSAATFFLRNDKVEVIQSKTPPTGFLWEVEFDVLYKKLYDGDKIILISDGVTDHMKGEHPEQELEAILPEICKNNPQQAAEELLSYVLAHNDGPPEDDMSVMVIYVWKKKHPY